MEKLTHNHAVIIGASMAGLLAAKAIAPHFDKVSILEKDRLPDGPVAHKGTSQAYHSHLLLKAGEEAIEELFPGIREELINAGSHYVEFGQEAAWRHHGYWKATFSKSFKILMQSRPFLEGTIRKRLLKEENVQLLEEKKVKDVLFDPANGSVSGVIIENKDREPEEMACDLLIDGSGAGSQAVKWLKKGNYPEPKVSKVQLDLTYSSRNFICPHPMTEKYKGVVIYFGPSQPTHTGLAFTTEKDEIMVSLGGYKSTPPTDDASFLAYAQQLDSTEIYDIFKSLKPASPIRHYKFPEQRRKHFERLTKFPSNLLVMGDAFCRFDPVFGQGMSVAAMEALALKNLMENGNGKSLARSFHKKASRIVGIPWLLSSLEGFRMKHTTGSKPLPVGMKFMHWYLGHIFKLSSTHSRIYVTFVEIFNLKKHPVYLFFPGVFFQVLKQGIRQALRASSPAV